MCTFALIINSFCIIITTLQSLECESEGAHKKDNTSHQTIDDSPKDVAPESKLTANPTTKDEMFRMNFSNNAFASGSNMNCGNVITDRPSSRVLNPPGGKSSITFG